MIKVTDLQQYKAARERKTAARAAKLEMELNWLREYHEAKNRLLDRTLDLTDKQLLTVHAGMHWLMRTKMAKSIEQAYDKAVSIYER